MNNLRWDIITLADHEVRRRRRIETRQARLQTMDPFQNMSNRQFIKTYRLSKDLARNLVQLLTPVMPMERRSDALSVTNKVLIALAFYATGSYQTIVGQSSSHNVSQATVSRALWQVTNALNNRGIFRQFVAFPSTREDRDRVKQEFYRKYRIPGIIGVIDGTHVAVVRPIVQEELYYNRKGYHSLNVMIICDANQRIMCIDPSHPGNTHDNIAWRSHPLHAYLNNKYDQEHLCLLGDSGYALRKIMMTPPSSSFQPNTPQGHYYELHMTARNVIERCIGVLKARFRCLLAARVMHYDPVFAGKMVNACAVLHNMAIESRLPLASTLSRQERRTERLLQVRRVAAESVLREAAQLPVQPSRRVNQELLEGRAAQEALIRRLWDERRAN